MSKTIIEFYNVSKKFAPPRTDQYLKEAFIKLTGLGKRVKTEGQQVLQDVSFDVKPGEFFGIMGRNGSGKSTLLKVLAGIYQPDKGRVVAKGVVISFIELGVGFHPELTGRDNVYLGGALMGFSSKEITNLYDNIVDFAGLQHDMDKKLKNYSSGMHMRLAFSLASRLEGDIYLLDEITAVGDESFKNKCLAYFEELKQSNKTVILVSHDTDSIIKYCDRAILIEDKVIHTRGPAEKVAEAYIKLLT